MCCNASCVPLITYQSSGEKIGSRAISAMKKPFSFKSLRDNYHFTMRLSPSLLVTTVAKRPRSPQPVLLAACRHSVRCSYSSVYRQLSDNQNIRRFAKSKMSYGDDLTEIPAPHIAVGQMVNHPLSHREKYNAAAVSRGRKATLLPERTCPAIRALSQILHLAAHAAPVPVDTEDTLS